MENQLFYSCPSLHLGFCSWWHKLLWLRCAAQLCSVVAQFGSDLWYGSGNVVATGRLLQSLLVPPSAPLTNMTVEKEKKNVQRHKQHRFKSASSISHLPQFLIFTIFRKYVFWLTKPQKLLLKSFLRSRFRCSGRALPAKRCKTFKNISPPRPKCRRKATGPPPISPNPLISPAPGTQTVIATIGFHFLCNWTRNGAGDKKGTFSNTCYLVFQQRRARQRL